MKTYKHTDGHAYWLDKGRLTSAPIFADDTLDLENTFNVDEDYTIPLPKKEREIIVSKLNEIKSEDFPRF